MRSGATASSAGKNEKTDSRVPLPQRGTGQVGLRGVQVRRVGAQKAVRLAADRVRGPDGGTNRVGGWRSDLQPLPEEPPERLEPELD
jgi:hypothetical protein